MADLYRPGAIFFAAESVGLSLFADTQRALEKQYSIRLCVRSIMVSQGHRN